MGLPNHAHPLAIALSEPGASLTWAITTEYCKRTDGSVLRDMDTVMEWAHTMSDDDTYSSREGSDVEADSSDSESQAGSDDSEPRQAPRQATVAPGIRQLHPLMHILANRSLRLAEPHAASSNEELIQGLICNDSLRKPELIAAMRACPRDQFVPEGDNGREAAFADSPLALQLGFNMSAPHIHASCLEALDLQPGHAVLDVGCGCGISTAIVAAVVGKAGQVTGIDCKGRAIALARKSVSTLELAGGRYQQLAGAVTLKQHNVFLPASFLTGLYDRVHVGAACPPNKVGVLRKLLKPSGGIIVTPVAPSDLQRITVNAEGHVRIETLSQVRYSNLEVPGDVEIVAAAMKRDRKARLAVPICPSTFEADIASMHGISGSSSGSSASTTDSLWQSSSDSLGATPGVKSPPAAATSWSKRFATRFLGCSGSKGHPEGVIMPGSPAGGSQDRVKLDTSELGPTDMLLTGQGWSVPVHRAVLRSRCDHFRARCDSGMRDALDTEAAVPEHFTLEAVEGFKRYCYQDDMESRTDMQGTLALLHVAHFFVAPRLAGLCDLAMSRNFKHASPKDEGACDMACVLLKVADELGLAHLQNVTLDFIVHNHAAASICAEYAALSKGQTDLVAAEACRLVASMQRLMQEVAC